MTAHFDKWKLELVSKHFKVPEPSVVISTEGKCKSRKDEILCELSKMPGDMALVTEKPLVKFHCSDEFQDEVLNSDSDKHSCDLIKDEPEDIVNNIEVLIEEILAKTFQIIDKGCSYQRAVEPEDSQNTIELLIEEIVTETFLLIDKGCSYATEDFIEFKNTEFISRSKNDCLGIKLFDCQNKAFVDDHLEDAGIENIDGLLSDVNFVEPVLDGLGSDEVENISQNTYVRIKNEVGGEKDDKLGGSLSEKQNKSGGNCVSVIIVWSQRELIGKYDGGRAKARHNIRTLAGSLCSYVKEELKFKCQSTLGTQLRSDYVFKDETQALQFVARMNDSIVVPKSLSMKVILSSEEDYGLGLEHVLTEGEVLTLQTFRCAAHVFRLFLDCQILTDGDKITFSFSSLSDVNLFLYNKSTPKYKLLGRLRKLCEVDQFKLVSNKDGSFALETNDLRVLTQKHWPELSSKFMFETKIKKGSKQLLFHNKRDLFSFYVSDEAKWLTSLWIPRSCIVRLDDLAENKLVSENSEIMYSKNLSAQLVTKIKELESVKNLIQRKERGIKENVLLIKNLNSKITSMSDVISNTLRLTDILKLEFKEENESSSNYPNCLKKFLQSEELLNVEEINGEIIFFFSCSNALEKLLIATCLKTVQKWSNISQLPLRAGFVSEKLFKSFGLLVYLEETSLIAKPIKEVENKLKAKNAKVECRTFGFAARFPTLLSFLQGLTDSEVHSYHKVNLMQENVVFMKRSNPHKFFNGKVCLTEDDCLRLKWKNIGSIWNGWDNTELDLFLSGFSRFLRDPRVKCVSEDWSGLLVLTFDSEECLESLLTDHCAMDSSAITKLTSLPQNWALKGSGLGYSVRCPAGVDFRHFFIIDNNSYISTDVLKISSPSRLFPFQCLVSCELRKEYPSLCLDSEDFVKL